MRKMKNTCRDHVRNDERVICLFLQHGQAPRYTIGNIERPIGCFSNPVVAMHISNSIMAAFFDVAITHRGRFTAQDVQIPNLVEEFRPIMKDIGSIRNVPCQPSRHDRW